MLTQVDLEEIRKVVREELEINVGRFDQSDVERLKDMADILKRSLCMLEPDPFLLSLASRIQDLL